MYSLKEILDYLGWTIPDIEKFSHGRRKRITNHVSAFTHLLSRGIPNADNLYFEELKSVIRSSPLRKKFKSKIYECINDKSLIDYDIPIPPLENYKFKFADIFCNSGGATLALMENGGSCIFASEDKHEHTSFAKAYYSNFGILPYANIENYNGDFPKVDIVVSSVDIENLPLNKGKRPKADKMTDTNWYLLLQLIKKFQPEAIMIECRKTQRNESLEVSTAVACRTLKEETGYYVVSPAILNALNHGLPQLRKRVWIVAFANPLSAMSFEWPKSEQRTWKLKDILENNPNPNLYLTQTHLDYLNEMNRKNLERGFQYSSIILDPERESKSISFGGQGWDRNLVYDKENAPTILPSGKEVNNEYLRRLSPRELCRLQGFPEHYKTALSWRTSWRLMGRATNINVASRIAKEILKVISENNINKMAKKLINDGLNFTN
jgi:DNA (cytosine-5)-methyltransferase 1